MMFFSGTCSATWRARLRSGTKRMLAFGSVRTTFAALAEGTMMSECAFTAAVVLTYETSAGSGGWRGAGERGACRRVRQQQGAGRVHDLRRLGHEVDAAEADDVGVLD